MRTRLPDLELNPRLANLPAKFEQIHPYQADAIIDICSAFLDDDHRVVVLDAPTGSGKTFIAELVRRILDTRACYVCHNKDLQTQFANDFPYSAVLYGRDNYTPRATIDRATCSDCTWSPAEPTCVLCPDHPSCPYQLAKTAAIRSPVPVLNSAYWLTETQNPRSRFANTGLVVLDEADTLENVLMGQVEVYVSARARDRYGIDPPRFLTKPETFGSWCAHAREQLAPHLERLEKTDLTDIRAGRELRRLVGLTETINGMAADLENDVPWVYVGGAGSEKRTGEEIAFKPVKVDRFGKDRIWARDRRFLLMSGSIISSGQLLSDLGWTDSYGDVKVESQFHPKNRPVIVRPVADMTRKGATDDQWERLGSSVLGLLDRHRRERVLIHSVSYNNAARLSRLCETAGRTVQTYRVGSDRARALADFRGTPGSVLIAPSFDRGVDLPGEQCRAQIILKVPYLNLGDRQVTERLYKTPDGKIWYQVHVARTIVQMVGRGVRNTEDWCVTYILDSTFKKWYSAWGHLLPKWFRRGIRFE